MKQEEPFVHQVPCKDLREVTEQAVWILQMGGSDARKNPGMLTFVTSQYAVERKGGYISHYAKEDIEMAM